MESDVQRARNFMDRLCYWVTQKNLTEDDDGRYVIATCRGHDPDKVHGLATYYIGELDKIGGSCRDCEEAASSHCSYDLDSVHLFNPSEGWEAVHDRFLVVGARMDKAMHDQSDMT